MEESSHSALEKAPTPLTRQDAMTPPSGLLEEHRPLIEQASFVLASELGVTEVDKSLQSTAIQAETLQIVRSSPEFTLVDSFPTLSGKAYFLYRRLAAGKLTNRDSVSCSSF